MCVSKQLYTSDPISEPVQRCTTSSCPRIPLHSAKGRLATPRWTIDDQFRSELATPLPDASVYAHDLEQGAPAVNET